MATSVNGSGWKWNAWAPPDPRRARLPGGIDEAGVTAMTRALVSDFVEAHDIVSPVLWYDTPMAFEISRRLPAHRIVYDCMDELSAFAGSPPCLVQKEQERRRHDATCEQMQELLA